MQVRPVATCCPGSTRRTSPSRSSGASEQVEAAYEAGMLDVRVRALVTPKQTPVRVPVAVGARQQAPVVEHEDQPV